MKDLPSHIHRIYRQAKLGYGLVKQIATDNPKISGYLPPATYNMPPAIYEQLTAFTAKQGLESVEMAVTVILSEYFELIQAANTATDTTDSRLEALEAKCSSLSETVVELQTMVAALQISSNPPGGDTKPPTDQSVPLETDTTDNQPVAPSALPLAQQLSAASITQAALAKRLGVSTSSITRMQSKPNFPEWSQQKDPEGIAWVKSPDTKQFYPQTPK